MRISTTLTALLSRACTALFLQGISEQQAASPRSIESRNVSYSGEAHHHKYTLKAYNNIDCTGLDGETKHLVPGKTQKIGVYARLNEWVRQSFYLTGPAFVKVCKASEHSRHFKKCVDLGRLEEGCHAIDPWALGVNWCLAKTIFVTGIDDGGASTLDDHDQTYQYNTSTATQPTTTDRPRLLYTDLPDVHNDGRYGFPSEFISRWDFIRWRYFNGCEK